MCVLYNIQMFWLGFNQIYHKLAKYVFIVFFVVQVVCHKGISTAKKYPYTEDPFGLHVVPICMH